ncbi:MAG: MMPL family transporter [Propionibacteriales bacterium]|nr:MMPL family transporter [Propionibacteriales bacterium]
MRRLSSLVVNKFSATLGALVLLAGVAVIIGLGTADRTTERTKQLPVGYSSTEAAELAARVPGGDGSVAVLLITSKDGTPLTTTDEQSGRDALLAAGSRGAERSSDGRALLAVVEIPADGASELQPLVEDLRGSLNRDLPSTLRAEVTGPAAIQADLAQVFDGANVRLLAATAGVVAVLLILTYRSPWLWLVPLTVIGIADQAAAALATHGLELLDIDWDGSTTGILSVLVFGAGTNYALLLISRYRDELRQYDDRRAAMRVALARTAEPVLASATTVVAGLLCLLLSVFPVTRGLGVACAIGIVVAAFFALVALPAVLVCFGRWIFWPRRPEVGSTPLSDGNSVWARVGSAVAARPRTLVGAAVGLLATLAVGLAGITLGLPTSEQFLDQPESIAAADRLATSFPAGSSEPATVWARDAAAAAPLLAGAPGVSSARPGAAVDGWSSFQVVLADPAGSAAARGTVTQLRESLADNGVTALVGGSTAETIDSGSATTRDRFVLFPVIAVLVLGALVLLLRSAVAPVVLVLTVLATYAAGLGASWWIFTGLLGFTGVDDGMPLLAFLFLVALGVDYNIFLVTRTWEEVTSGHTPRVAVRRALAATGGVITSAGILLASVFAVLGVLPLVVLAQLGVAICIGVLLDTLLVRTVLVPGLATLLGDRFWWPRNLPTQSV